jgi:hypothetical protein
MSRFIISRCASSALPQRLPASLKRGFSSAMALDSAILAASMLGCASMTTCLMNGYQRELWWCSASLRRAEFAIPTCKRLPSAAK